MIIGRDKACDIYLDIPIVQKKPLISGQHASIINQGREFKIFDGLPARRPSSNGTFVNGRQINYQHGQTLQDGDTIILAALDPNNPRPDTPGVVELVFRVLPT